MRMLEALLTSQTAVCARLLRGGCEQRFAFTEASQRHGHTRIGNLAFHRRSLTARIFWKHSRVGWLHVKLAAMVLFCADNWTDGQETEVPALVCTRPVAGQTQPALPLIAGAGR